MRFCRRAVEQRCWRSSTLSPTPRGSEVRAIVLQFAQLTVVRYTNDLSAMGAAEMPESRGRVVRQPRPSYRRRRARASRRGHAMFAVRDILIFGVVAGLLVGAALALWPW